MNQYQTQELELEVFCNGGKYYLGGYAISALGYNKYLNVPDKNKFYEVSKFQLENLIKVYESENSIIIEPKYYEMNDDQINLIYDSKFEDELKSYEEKDKNFDLWFQDYNERMDLEATKSSTGRRR